MEYPHVQFQINEDLDRWTAREFRIGVPEGVEGFYKINGDELQRFIATARESWDSISPLFFDTVSMLFHQHPWPKGEYIGYASMFDCNPRFLDTKTFQVYYKHRAGSNYVTAHELLHFMFYDYAVKKHADLFEGKSTETGIFWDVAEVFNAVLLHSPLLLPIHNIEEPIVYPEHKNWVEHMKEAWNNNSDIDSFIIRAYQYISK
jgi:hypothetical protein